MQFKSSVLATLTFITIATAGGTCNTGPIQCCNSIENASTPSIANILSTLGIAAQGVTGLVGLTCTPITIIGTGGNSCSAQPVCCLNNNFNGVVALGCTPVNLNL